MEVPPTYKVSGSQKSNSKKFPWKCQKDSQPCFFNNIFSRLDFKFWIWNFGGKTDLNVGHTDDVSLVRYQRNVLQLSSVQILVGLSLKTRWELELRKMYKLTRVKSPPCSSESKHIPNFLEICPSLASWNTWATWPKVVPRENPVHFQTLRPRDSEIVT